MTDSRKLLVVLGMDFHFRSYWSTNLHDNLSRNFSVEYAISREIPRTAVPLGAKFFIFQSSKLAEKLFDPLLNASLVRNRNKSSSFRFRIERMLRGDYETKLGFDLAGVGRLSLAATAALPGVFYLLGMIYRALNYAPKTLIQALEGSNAPLIVCWAQSMEPATQISLNLAKRVSAKTVFVFDNWDNLSSKAVMPRKPDFTVCFGEQSKSFASKIHGQSESRIFPLGSARFDVYGELDGASESQRESILVAGSSIALEDVDRLEVIDTYLADSCDETLKSFKFLYRPHPVPQGLGLDVNKWKYKHIQLDPTLSRLRAGSLVKWDSQENTARQLAKHKIVVAGPTTLILEALLSGCFVILPTFQTRGVRTTTLKMLAQLEHLKGIESLSNLYIADSPPKLLKLIVELSGLQPGVSIKDELKYFVNRGNSSFSERLSSLLVTL